MIPIIINKQIIYYKYSFDVNNTNNTNNNTNNTNNNTNTNTNTNNVIL